MSDDRPEPATSGGRVRALDAVRGIAALVVVVGHSMMVQPPFADAVAYGTAVHGWEAWATYSPLHLAWAGGEAVFVFFVLSGVVLTLPFLEPVGARRWRAYYASRVARLYLPVAGALLLAVVLFELVSRHDQPSGASWWLQEHDITIGPGLVFTDLSLLWPASLLDSPLWSLRWEVIFSLTLPLFVLAARRLRGVRALAALAVLLLAMPMAVRTGVDAAIYMPMFGIGCLIAANRTEACAWYRERATWQRVAIAAFGLVLVGWRWWPVTSFLPGAVAPTVLGAAILVLAAMSSAFGERWGASPIPRWLGSRSFSLYLVHEPILVTSALALRTTNPGLVLAVGGVAALVGTDVFYRLVERPSHRLAVRIGKRLQRPDTAVRPSDEPPGITTVPDKDEPAAA